MEVVVPMAENRNGPADQTHRIVVLIESFAKFPSSAPVDSFLLACSGFYYTGFGDRVVCSSCGVRVENWQPGDDAPANVSKFHEPNCQFYNPTRNTGSPFTNQGRSCAVGRSAGDVLMSGLSRGPADIPPYKSVVASPVGDTNDIQPHFNTSEKQSYIPSKHLLKDC